MSQDKQLSITAQGLATTTGKRSSLVGRGLAAIVRMERAVDKSNISNMNNPLMMGKMFRYGIGVEQNDEQARYWLEIAAKQGDPAAQYEFGLFLLEVGETEEACDLFQCASDQEYGPAQYLVATVGTISFDVSDEQIDMLLHKAFVWYEQRVNSDDDELGLAYALMHLNVGVKEKYHRANATVGFNILRAIVAKPVGVRTDIRMQVYKTLGIELLKISLDKETILQAIRWLEQAANLGDSLAAETLARLYLLGYPNNHELKPKLVEINQALAVLWYERAIQVGSRYYSRHLGLLYLEGKYLPENLALAEKWLLHSAQAGNEFAALNLGLEYASGAKFEQNTDKALYWLKLATTSSVQATKKLAEIYLDGEIVPINLDEAIKWLTKASEKYIFRNDAMQLAIAKCFDGRFNILEESIVQAWLKKTAAITLGDVLDTQHPEFSSRSCALAEIYELGLGVNADINKAIYWYKKSASDGLYKAMKHLNELGIDWNK